MEKLEKHPKGSIKGKNAVDYRSLFRKLKKCPVCGGKAELYYTIEDKLGIDNTGIPHKTDEKYKLYTVHCLACGAKCNKSGLTELEAVKYWNKAKKE